MGQTIVESVGGKVKEAGIFSILVDEVTDGSKSSSAYASALSMISKMSEKNWSTLCTDKESLLVENIRQTLEKMG